MNGSSSSQAGLINDGHHTFMGFVGILQVNQVKLYQNTYMSVLVTSHLRNHRLTFRLIVRVIFMLLIALIIIIRPIVALCPIIILVRVIPPIKVDIRLLLNR